MSTETKEAAELDIAPGFDEPIACQWVSPACDREAEWAVINRCCSQTFSLCEEHRIATDEYIKDVPAAWVLCTGCNASGVVWDWRRL